MARKCSVCKHPQAREINRAILAGDTIKEVTEAFSVKRSAVSLHRKNHLKQAPLQVAAPHRTVAPNYKYALPERAIEKLQDDVELSALTASDITRDWVVRRQGALLERMDKLCDRFEENEDLRGLLDGMKAAASQIKELGASSGAVQSESHVRVDVSISARSLVRELDLSDAPTAVRTYLAKKLWETTTDAAVIEHGA